MVKNQLFRILPDINTLLILLATFGLSSLTDTKFFTKKLMDELGTIYKINNIKDELYKYYLPCKSKIYIEDITLNKCITILRQFLKVHNYTLISKEKYIDSNKMSVYRLIEIDDKIIDKKPISRKKITISFE
tara:strand:+ start:112 stop:507 length:396 start_codon:yes stop_codon:yes gene_type:complete